MDVARLSQSRAVRAASTRLLRSSLVPRRPASTAALGPLRPSAGAGGDAQSGRGAPRKVQTRRSSTGIVPPPADIAVIGGGITGLTTAYYLAKLLPPTSRVTLYEGADRLGGWIQTVKRETSDGETVQFENGVRMLRGLGKNGFRADDYVFYDLIAHLQLEVQATDPRKKLICFNDKLVYIPPKDVAGWIKALWQAFWGKHIGTGAFSAILPFRRLSLRRFPPDAVNYDVSVSEWLRMTLGDNPVGRGVLSAMMHGIFGGSIDKLGMASVMPAMWYRLHMQPARGMQLIPKPDWDLMRILDIRNRGSEEETEKLRDLSVQEIISFPAGMETIIDALKEGLATFPNITVKTGAPVSKIRYLEKQDKVELTTPSGRSVHNKVISTTPSTSLAPLIPSVALPTDSVTIRTVSFWYPEENLTSHLDAIGYLLPITTPNPEQILGVLFDSDIYGFAPGEARGTKLTVLMGGHFWSDLPSPPDEATCVERARAAVARHVGITAAPEITYANLAVDCIPQHGPAHRALLAQAHSVLEKSFGGKLAVAGGSYTPIGMLPAMRAGFDMACHVAGAPLDHVGETGLGQFWRGMDILQMPIQELNALGKTLGKETLRRDQKA